MKIIHIEKVISTGRFPRSRGWKRIRKDLHEAIQAVVWPPGNDQFTIYPQSGKKRGEGNGVKPIKSGLMIQLGDEGWELEQRLNIIDEPNPGPLDAVLETKFGPFAVEWETGNVSSSHRALNKMSLGLLKKKLAGGTLIVPSRNFYRYLTDRIGNFPELEPYLDLWRSVPYEEGLLEIVVVEYDATSEDVPRIPKTTDGRALL